jgi:hypothetical protein
MQNSVQQGRVAAASTAEVAFYTAVGSTIKEYLPLYLRHSV